MSDAERDILVKICGLSTPETIQAAARAGAAYVGLNFFPPSPRAISPEEAEILDRLTPPGLVKVGVFVDPDDALLEAVLSRVGLDMIQLHGNETRERLSAIRDATGLPIMKAVAIAEPDDLPRLDAYEAVADQILCDAKPAPGATRPGGLGLPFDWRLVAERRWSKPWMLSGGLTVGNVAEAIRLTGARQIDLSSGVESAPGVKSVEMIAAFMGAALSAGRGGAG